MTPVVGTKITIGGWAGTGKGTISELLAKLLGCELNSAGNYFRAIARREGMTNRELEEAAILDPKYDIEVDTKTMRYGETHNSFIFEGRIAWHCIPDSVKILLVCGWNTRIKRIAQREKISFGDAWSDTMHREESARRRYLDLYGIENINNKRHYGLVVNTEETDIEGSVAIIRGYLSFLSSGGR